MLLVWLLTASLKLSGNNSIVLRDNNVIVDLTLYCLFIRQHILCLQLPVTTCLPGTLSIMASTSAAKEGRHAAHSRDGKMKNELVTSDSEESK